jgi:hypothetical protein
MKNFVEQFCDEFLSDFEYIFLTGSYNTSEEDRYSDVDLLVVSYTFPIDLLYNIQFKGVQFDIIYLPLQNLHDIILREVMNGSGAYLRMLSNSQIIKGGGSQVFNYIDNLKNYYNLLFKNCHNHKIFSKYWKQFDDLLEDLCRLINSNESVFVVNSLIDLISLIELFSNHKFPYMGKWRGKNLKKYSPTMYNDINWLLKLNYSFDGNLSRIFYFKNFKFKKAKPQKFLASSTFYPLDVYTYDIASFYLSIKQCHILVSNLFKFNANFFVVPDYLNKNKVYLFVMDSAKHSKILKPYHKDIGLLAVYPKKSLFADFSSLHLEIIKTVRLENADISLFFAMLRQIHLMPCHKNLLNTLRDSIITKMAINKGIKSINQFENNINNLLNKISSFTLPPSYSQSNYVFSNSLIKVIEKSDSDTLIKAILNFVYIFYDIPLTTLIFINKLSESK